jgi:hypothetical protein
MGNGPRESRTAARSMTFLRASGFTGSLAGRPGRMILAAAHIYCGGFSDSGVFSSYSTKIFHEAKILRK